MTMLGKNITAYNDPLVKISEKDLFSMVKDSPEELKNKIHQLRNIATIDPKKYRQLKTMLPYVTCGHFNPAIRKTENFSSISHFIIDIDHLKEKELSVENLRFDFMLDNRVVMAFVSPSGNGLKLLFRLKEKCHDYAQFSIFYKLFAQHFSQQYQLFQVVDNKTSDVTRACFLSYDPDCSFNQKAEAVDMNSYINFSSTIEVKEVEQSLLKYEKEVMQVAKELIPKAEEINEISPEILHHIRQKLNPNIRTKKEKIIYVPEQLEEIITKLSRKLNQFDIEVKAIENINYGKKFVVSLSQYWAEINVFYGKKGFSVVKTPKRGSNPELADIVNRIFCEELY